MGFVSNISGDLGQSTGTLGNMGGTLTGDVMGMGPGGFGSQNYESTQATRANPNLGLGFGMPSGDNPVYGQQSPFQPPTNIGGGNAQIGVPTVGYPGSAPQNGVDIGNIFSGITSEIGNSIIGGIGGKGGFNGGNAQIGLPGGPQFGGGMIPPGISGLGQVKLDANGQPIAGSGTFNGQAPTNRLSGMQPQQPISSPRQVPAPANRPVFNQANQPGGVIGSQQQFRGGLRPAPRNYRPPTRTR
jgi:hypothetical protein